MVQLLWRAHWALGKDDSALAAKTTARLAAALVPQRSAAETEQVLQLAQTALEMARRLDDPKTLLFTLLYARAATVPLVSNNASLALTEELLALARGHAQPFSFITVGPKHSVSLLERGRRSDAEIIRAEVVDLDAKLRYPLARWRVPMMNAAFAMFDGNLDEAAELGDEAWRLARQAGSRQAELLWSQQRIALAIAHQAPERFEPVASRILLTMGQNPTLASQRAWVLAAPWAPRRSTARIGRKCRTTATLSADVRRRSV